jgi:hypothetical protein
MIAGILVEEPSTQGIVAGVYPIFRMARPAIRYMMT